MLPEHCVKTLRKIFEKENSFNKTELTKPNKMNVG